MIRALSWTGSVHRRLRLLPILLLDAPTIRPFPFVFTLSSSLYVG